MFDLLQGPYNLRNSNSSLSLLFLQESDRNYTKDKAGLLVTWLGFFSSEVILSWLLPTKETERLLLRCNCFSKDSANSWMEFDLVSGHELSPEGVLLAFLWQWHLTSWSSWNSLGPLTWPEDEPLVEAWSRVVWREESLAWKTRGLCWLLNIKTEHTGQILSATKYSSNSGAEWRTLPRLLYLSF